MRTRRSGFSAIALALALLLAAPAGTFAQGTAAQGAVSQGTAPPAGEQAQVPQPPEGGVNWGGAGYGVATVLADLIYVPVKVVYAVLGGLIGAGSWALTGGNSQVANTVWRSTLGGDYVLTPDMIAGNKPINFSGPTETAPESPSASASSASAAPAATAVVPAPSYAPAPGSSAISSQPIDRGSGPVGPTEKSIE